MKNLRLSIKLLLILLSLSLSSCLPKEEKPQLRIVDLQGKARKVTTRYPALNVMALNSQGMAYEKTSQGAFANSIRVSSSPTYVKKDNPNQEVLLNQDVAQKNFVETKDGAGSVPQGLVSESVVDNGVVANQVEEIVEYDLGGDKISKEESEFIKKQDEAKKELAENKPIKSKSKIAKKSNASGKYFIQVGSFASESGAESTLNKMQKFHKGRVQESSGAKKLYRVWLGPFSSKAKANALAKKIIASGNAAILVKDK